jgi:hypothetical protein
MKYKTVLSGPRFNRKYKVINENTGYTESFHSSKRDADERRDRLEKMDEDRHPAYTMMQAQEDALEDSYLP